MPPDRYASTTAFHELFDLLQGADRRFFEGPNALGQEADVLDGYRWIPTLLRVAMEVCVWAEPRDPRFVEIVGPHMQWGGDNSDAFYQFAPLDPSLRYRVRGQKGDAVYLSLTVYNGPRDDRASDRIVGTLNDRDIRIEPDGSFEITLGPEPGGRNHLKLDPDAVCAITRDYIVDPRNGRRARWSIQALDPAPALRIGDAELARRLREAACFVRDQLSIVPLMVPPSNTLQPPYPVPPATRGWAAGDAAYAMGSFELDDDEALRIHGRSPECVFWNLCLWNPFLHCYDYERERVTINSGQVRYEDDGSWVVVVSRRDPGVANWVSTADRRSGLVWIRWFLPAETPKPLDVRVVRLGELRR